jgi:hypothetical protein
MNLLAVDVDVDGGAGRAEMAAKLNEPECHKSQIGLIVILRR